jgi:Family of unknown function (DUF6062)
MTSEPDRRNAPHRAGRDRLPTRDVADMHLAELLESPGCPLCRTRLREARRHLRSVLYESVNDPAFRGRLLAARGFCRAHSHQLLAANRAGAGGSLGAAILFGSVIRKRLAELKKTAGGRGRQLDRDLEVARRPASCPTCEQVESAQASAVSRLLDRTSDEHWRSALAAAELCLDDLLLLAAAADHRSGWSEVFRAQVARIEDIAARLEGFAYNSSYDRLHLMTDAERRASDEAAALLGGTVAEAQSR